MMAKGAVEVPAARKRRGLSVRPGATRTERCGCQVGGVGVERRVETRRLHRDRGV
jgi:hypothetical protein